jgi:hypothetical protein
MSSDFTTSPSRFVFDKGYELRPTCIADGLGKLVILDHARNVQRFQADATKVIDNGTTQLGGESPCADCVIFSWVAATTSLALLRLLLPLTLRDRRRWRIFSRFSALRRCLGQAIFSVLVAIVVLDLALNADEVLAGLGFRHGTVLHLSLNASVTNDFHPAHLGKIDTVALQLEALRVVN